MKRLQIIFRTVVAAAVISAAAPAIAQSIVTCESEQYRYNRCPVDTRGGVRLLEQLSWVERDGSHGKCVYHQSWGYNRSGIWVNNGCRARFEVGNPGWHDSSSGSWSGGGGDTVRCESYDGRRNYCRADTSGGVRLDHQLSNFPCRYGRDWGYDHGGLWVDNGCRADFELGHSSYGGGHAGHYSSSWENSPGGTIVCESWDYRREYCPADTRGGVSLAREASSGSLCAFNRTWGYDSGGVWVSNGCRGTFSLGHPGASHQSHDSDHDAEKVAAAALVFGAIAAIAASAEKHDKPDDDRDWE